MEKTFAWWPESPVKRHTLSGSNFVTTLDRLNILILSNILFIFYGSIKKSLFLFMFSGGGTKMEHFPEIYQNINYSKFLVAEIVFRPNVFTNL